VNAGRIDRAGPNDLAALLRIDVSLVARERQDAIVRESVATGRCLGAWVGAALAGYVTWDRGFFDRPFVRLLAIDAPFRRRGLGAALVAAVEADVRERSLDELFISTEFVNAPMQALLERAGYTRSGSIDNINVAGNPELVYHKRV
jgi:GNAT superfamily N-acetyltransferase